MRSKKWNKPFKGEWASTLQSYVKNLEEPVGKEWKTTSQVMESFGLQHTRGGGRHLLLADMCKKGLLESKKFRILDSTGRRILPIVHFRLVKKPTSSQK
jgi:hypothetical protein